MTCFLLIQVFRDVTDRSVVVTIRTTCNIQTLNSFTRHSVLVSVIYSYGWQHRSSASHTHNRYDKLFSVGLPLCAICHRRPLSLEPTSTRMMRGQYPGNLRPVNFLFPSNGNVSLLRSVFSGLCNATGLYVLNTLYVLWTGPSDIPCNE